MEHISMKLCEITTRKLFIGLEGEQNHIQVVFEASSILNAYPDASVALTVKPPVGDIYPKAVTKDGTNVLWNVSASDCANNGEGEYQITFTNGEEIIKSFIGGFVVFNSLVGNATPPEPVEEWLQEAQEALGELNDLSASASGVPYGSEPTAQVTQVGGHKNIAFEIPAGQPGQAGTSPTIQITDIEGGHRITVTDVGGSASFDVMDGTPGKDGTSPTVTITDITGGHTVTITDKNGAHSFNVMDGVDGYSPSASVSKSGNTVTISITDKTGTTTATITEGDPTSIIDDTAGEGDVDKVWSAAKTDEEVSSIKRAINSKQDAPASAGTDGQFLGLALVDGQLVPVWEGLPIAGQDADHLGVGYFNANEGVQIGSNGKVSVACSNSSNIKGGQSLTRPIVPNFQHESAFYGLAKAANADMASLPSVTVGQYPEAQKRAITDMIEPQFRLIKEVTITEEVTGVLINTDSNGDSFSLKDVIFELDEVIATGTGNAGVSVNSGSSASPSSGGYVVLLQGYNTTAQNRYARIKIEGGRFFGESTDVTVLNAYTKVNKQTSKNACGLIECNAITEIYYGCFNNFKLSSGKIKVYGR